jgi:Arc/MetJ family transcription regulator
MTHAINDKLGPLHNSHLTALRRCQKRFHYSFVEGIQSKVPGLPLARGIWIHYMLEAQFLRWGLDEGTLLETPESMQVDGVTGEVVITVDNQGNPCLVTWSQRIYPLSAKGMLDLLTEQVWARLFPEEHEKYTEDGATLPEACEKILTEYFYYWRGEPKPKVLLVESSWTREYKGVAFEGRLDYVIERTLHNGQKLLVVGDWKSTKRQPGPLYKFMESQLNLYPWGITPKLLELGIPEQAIKSMAVEFDYLNTKLPTKPQQNKDGTLSKRKINTTYLTLANALKEYGLTVDKQFIEDYLERNELVFFDRKPLPRNQAVVTRLLDENVESATLALQVIEGSTPVRSVTQTCSYDCDFQELCMGELYGMDMKYLRNTKFEARTNSKHAGTVDMNGD